MAAFSGREDITDLILSEAILIHSLKAYLCSNISPFNIVDSALAVIDSVSFTGSFHFVNTPAGTYYIKIRHRNTMETWSKAGGEFFNPGSTSGYDFTASETQAFGNNLIQVSVFPDRFAVLSGDVDQNGYIDFFDIILTNNSTIAFESGYISTDVNGNGAADLKDILITYNNSLIFVSIIKP